MVLARATIPPREDVLDHSSRVRRPPLPPALRDALVPIAGRLEAWRYRKLTPRQRWERELGTEVEFWDRYLGDLAATDDLPRYRDPESSWADDDVYRRVIERVEGERVAVLDVGAGPLTAVPKRFPGRDIVITAFDPLADAYNARLDQVGIVPLVRTQASDGEHILDHVAEGSFDIAHATNCLDHAYDPALVVRSMVRALRPGGVTLLRHHRNEATKQHYLGLHQWNFDDRDGDFVVWRPDTERNLSRELADLGSGEIWHEGDEIIWVFTRA
jgi:SAM-dependent methyltransferase